MTYQYQYLEESVIGQTGSFLMNPTQSVEKLIRKITAYKIPQSDVTKYAAMYEQKLDNYNRMLRAEGISPQTINKVTANIIQKYGPRIKQELSKKYKVSDSDKLTSVEKRELAEIPIGMKYIIKDILIELKITINDPKIWTRAIGGVILTVVLSGVLFGLMSIIGGTIWMYTGIGLEVVMGIISYVMLVVVTPILEEAYKSATVSSKMTGVGFIAFNLYEFIGFLAKGQNVYIRLGVVLFHMILTLIHKEGNIRGDITGNMKMYKSQALIITRILHGFFNGFGIFGRNNAQIVTALFGFFPLLHLSNKIKFRLSPIILKKYQSITYRIPNLTT